jgi:flagellar motor protein MotB
MKVDTDSILYIVITIIVLIISGLGSWRKKKAQQMQAQASAETKNEYSDSMSSRPVEFRASSAPQQLANPLERLEQFFSGQFPETESMESESLETPEDEEDLILEEISRRDQEEEIEVVKEEPAEDTNQTANPEKKGMLVLFNCIDEVKKAVIYSEIMERKYR